MLLQLFQRLPSYDSLSVKIGQHISDWRSLYWTGKYNQSTRYTSVFETEDIQYLEENYNAKLKNKIKNAEQHLEIRLTDDIENCFELIEKTFARKNDRLSFNKSVFENTAAVFKNNNRLKIWKAYFEGRLIGCMIFFVDQKTSYLMYSGVDTEYINYNSQSLLLHNGIKYFLSEGVRVDLEGSMIKTIDDFFSNFNLEQYHT